jgi:hypothetical protein
MPCDFIDGLKDKNWTRINHKWLARLMKHLKIAQSSNIKQIRFIRRNCAELPKKKYNI